MFDMHAAYKCRQSSIETGLAGVGSLGCFKAVAAVEEVEYIVNEVELGHEGSL